MAQSNGESDAAPFSGGAQVARVYAEALLNVAVKRHQADAMLEHLEALVRESFRAEPRLEQILSSRAVMRETKEKAIKAAFGGRADPTFVNFLLVLNRHNRLDLLRAIWAAYRDLYDVLKKRVRVKVRTAVPLPDDRREALRRELHDYFQMEPVLEERVDPELLGGMVVQIGDRVLDTSVRTKLDRVKNHLLASGNHEIQSRRDRFSH